MNLKPLLPTAETVPATGAQQGMPCCPKVMLAVVRLAALRMLSVVTAMSVKLAGDRLLLPCAGMTAVNAGAGQAASAAACVVVVWLLPLGHVTVMLSRAGGVVLLLLPALPPQLTNKVESRQAAIPSVS
ncbi:MAG: hypothetical protein ABL906_07765 [Sideroxydans sp.]